MNVKEFEKQLRLNYSSKKTVESYMKQIRPFLNFCNGKVTQDNLDEYFLNRREKVSTTSCNLWT